MLVLIALSTISAITRPVMMRWIKTRLWLKKFGTPREPLPTIWHSDARVQWRRMRIWSLPDRSKPWCRSAFGPSGCQICQRVHGVTSYSSALSPVLDAKALYGASLAHIVL
jgi:hypothetical protein